MVTKPHTLSECSMNSARLSRIWTISGMSWDISAFCRLLMRLSWSCSVSSDQQETNAALNRSLKDTRERHPIGWWIWMREHTSWVIYQIKFSPESLQQLQLTYKMVSLTIRGRLTFSYMTYNLRVCYMIGTWYNPYSHTRILLSFTLPSICHSSGISWMVPCPRCQSDDLYR